MAARTRKIRHDENTRAKIQTSQLINRLQDHIDGKVELETSQVRGIEILLKKTLPDMSSIDQTIDDKRQHIISDKPLTNEEWEAKHSNGRIMESAGRTSDSTH